MGLLQTQLIDLEKALLTDEVRISQQKLDELIHDDFIEFSQSGKQYGKKEVLDTFKNYQPDASQYETAHFRVRELSKDLAQITYETLSAPKNNTEKRIALRSSLWKYADNRWKMIFHQGTIKEK